MLITDDGIEKTVETSSSKNIWLDDKFALQLTNENIIYL